MVRPATRLERFLRARINLRILGRYLGTGHHGDTELGYDTDPESEVSSDTYD